MRALMFLVAAMVSMTAGAQQWSHLERVAAVIIKIDDQVTDGCWPRPEATREAVELVFRSAGILVTDTGHWIKLAPANPRPYSFSEYRSLPPKERERSEWASPHTFVIAVLGGMVMTEGGVSAGCVVALNVTLEKAGEEVSSLHYQGVVGRGLYGGGMVLSVGPRAEMQKKITEGAKEVTTSLANATLRARDNPNK